MTAPVLVIEPSPIDPVGRLGDWLRAEGLELDVVRVGAGDAVPADLDGYAGLVVMGGEMSATDDDIAPWLPAIRSLISEAERRDVPTLGICLGHQLMAVARGGRVGPNPEGPEYGAQLIAKRAASATDPLFRELPITPDVIQWHTDAVTQPPPGAVVLASSPGCDVQAMRTGRVAWGLQCHIETTTDVVRSWAEHDAEALEDYDVERILQRSDAVHEDIAEVWTPFARAFATVVRDPAAVAGLRPIIAATAAPVTDPAAIRAALAAELTASRQGGPVRLPLLEPPAERPPS